jgi:hypothetical protein
MRLGLALCVVGLAMGCSADASCPEPTYLDDASDEAYLALVDARDRVVANDGQAAQWDVPLEGASLLVDGAAPTLSWTSPLVAGVEPRVRGVRFAKPWLDGWFELVVPMAKAHLPPITGDVHWVEVRAVGASAACPLVHGLTTTTSWSTAGEVWNAWRAVPGSYELSIVSAYLEDNRVTEGPFQSSLRRVQVQ